MISQIYVSRSLIDPADKVRIMDDIITGSIARNTVLGITGMLIVSPDHFAQLLEGPMLDVFAVMTRIMADPRHTACRVIRNSRIEKASYSQWRIARFDSDNFGSNIIDPLLMAAHAGKDALALHRLERLIDTIATDSTKIHDFDAEK